MLKKIGMFNNFLPSVKGISSFGKKSLTAAYNGLKKQVNHGLKETAMKLTSAKSLKQSTGMTQAFSQQIQRHVKVDSTVVSKRAGSILNTTQQYQMAGKETIKSSLVSESLNKQVTANKGSQLTHILEQKNTVTNIGSQLNKTINTELGIKTYGNAQNMVREYDLKTQTEQNAQRLTQTQATSDVTKEVSILDKKGNVVGESFSHRIGEVDTASNWAQQMTGQEEKKVREVTSVDREKVGSATVTHTQIQSQSVRESETNVFTASQTDIRSKSADYNEAGEIIAQRSAHQQTESQSIQQVTAEEKNKSQRDIFTIQQGQESMTIEKGQGLSELVQTTLGKASSVVSQLDANGNAVAQKATESQSESDLSRQIKTDNERVIIRGPDEVRGYGAYQEQSATKISNTSQVIAGAAAESERQIEAKKNIDWEGSIQIDQAQPGAKAFSISNVEITSAVTQDVTKSGKNQVTVDTTTEIGKTVTGTVEAKVDAVKPVANVPQATIAVNFGTYTGLGAGFKMDSGEVKFELKFSSAEMTKQSTVRESGDAVVSETESKTGQTNDASLVGTLRSFTNAEGKRVIEVSASYVKDGAKFANDEAGVAIAGAATNVDIKGSMVIEGNNQSKSIQSEFELYKNEEVEGEGTSATALKKAMDISDPLRKNFSFDKGIFSFQLGFASMNIAVYA